MATHANALAELAEIAPTLFPEGSDGGDALPVIWEDNDDFQAKLAAFQGGRRELQGCRGNR